MSAYTNGTSTKAYADVGDLRTRARVLIGGSEAYPANRHIGAAREKASMCLIFCDASDRWYQACSLDRCETYRYLAQEILDEAEETLAWILSVPLPVRDRVCTRQDPTIVTGRTILALHEVANLDAKAGGTGNLDRYLARRHAYAHPRKLATLREMHAAGTASARKWTPDATIALVGRGAGRST